MGMKRYIVNPFNFGSTDGYGWVDEDAADPDAAIAAHHDYCGLYAGEYSVRVWEPGRHRVSQPGILQLNGLGDSALQAPELPLKVEIHGIKGAAHFHFDGTDQGVGAWRDQFGDEHPVQPSARDTYNALSGCPMLAYNTSSQDNLAQSDRNPAFKIPLFCALYRGTYKQIDDLSGWEIDTGPGDDPDTLLSLNITNPQVLESSRLDWWDLDWVSLPKNKYDQEFQSETDYRCMSLPGSSTFHKYSMDLKANKHLKPDQVLWLHWMTGVIRLPVALPDQEGGTGAPQLVCAYYTGHRFSISVQASMLATVHVQV